MLLRFKQRLLLFLILVLTAGSAHAQDGNYSQAQRELNEKAAQAVEEERYADAVQMLQSSLQLGELNFTYLQLGVVYAKWNKCDKAQESFDNVLTAPKASAPSPQQVAEFLGQAKGRLEEICDGTLVVRCTPQDIDVSINGDTPMSCLNQPFQVPPGEHTVVATHVRGKNEDTKQVSIRGTKTMTIELQVDVTPKKNDPPPQLAPPPPSYTMTIIGGVVGALGVAALVTAGIFELDGEEKTQEFEDLGPDLNSSDAAIRDNAIARREVLSDELSDLRIIATTLWIAGGLLTATGVVLIALNLSEHSSYEEEWGNQPEVGFWVAPEGGGGITLQMRW